MVKSARGCALSSVAWLAAEIKRVEHDLKGEHRRKLLNLAYCAKLEARITELQEQLDAAQIAEAFEATVERELERG
jgi:hypothetical protein